MQFWSNKEFMFMKRNQIIVEYVSIQDAGKWTLQSVELSYEVHSCVHEGEVHSRYLVCFVVVQNPDRQRILSGPPVSANKTEKHGTEKQGSSTPEVYGNLICNIYIYTHLNDTVSLYTHRHKLYDIAIYRDVYGIRMKMRRERVWAIENKLLGEGMNTPALDQFKATNRSRRRHIFQVLVHPLYRLVFLRHWPLFLHSLLLGGQVKNLLQCSYLYMWTFIRETIWKPVNFIN